MIENNPENVQALNEIMVETIELLSGDTLVLEMMKL